MARVVIVEDEPLYRDLLHGVLSRQPDLEVAGVFGDAAAALDRTPGLRPDVALLDIELGGAMDGIELGLRPRQRELLELLAQGLSNAGIAHRMVLAEKSVENSITRLYQELEVDREDPTVQPRVRAVLTYLRESRLTHA